jgi:hypothetical protein
LAEQGEETAHSGGLPSFKDGAADELGYLGDCQISYRSPQRFGIIANDAEHIVAAAAEQPANPARRMAMVDVEDVVALRVGRRFADGAPTTLRGQHCLVIGKGDAILANQVAPADFNLLRLISPLFVVGLTPSPMALVSRNTGLAA